MRAMGTPPRIALNGFGRIGRQVVRQIVTGHRPLELVAINSGRGSPSALAQLLTYDSVYGRFGMPVAPGADHLAIDGRRIPLLAEPDPRRLPWADLGVDVVVEATGSFTDRDGAAQHLRAGARKVLVTAPTKRADLTAVVGVNDDCYDHAAHDVVSAASCTTNCLAPMVQVLHARFGVLSGVVTTIHAYTRDQELQDAIHDDPRRGRAAGLNVTPTRTGAAEAINPVLPALAGRLAGIAVRVPVPSVSLVDLSVLLDQDVTADSLNGAFTAASARERWHGVLATSDEPLVSSDYVGDAHSCTIDLPSTRTSPGGHAKVLGWYDNEAGYAARVIDLALRMASPLVASADRRVSAAAEGRTKTAS